MALIECIDCKGKVSTDAAACPHCGKPNAIQTNSVLEVRFENNMFQLNRNVQQSRELCMKAIDSMGLKYGAGPDWITIQGGMWKHNAATLGLDIQLISPTHSAVSYQNYSAHFGPGVSKLAREFEAAFQRTCALKEVSE